MLKLLPAILLLVSSYLIAQPSSPAFQDRLTAALFAAAIGDAMGAPIEGWHPDKIQERFPDWDFTTFLPPTKQKDLEKDTGKGNGRFTDDLLAIEAIINIYNTHQDHLDAYDYAELFVREIGKKKVYIPERKEDRYPLDRPLFWPERYMYHRLVWNQVNPRKAGVGNWLGNGFSAFTLPTGAVNAGDPWRAYDETASYGIAHTESYTLEAGAVNAAAFAAAFAPDATLESVIATARKVARDGTKLALEDALKATDHEDDFETFRKKVRQVYLNYAQLPPALLAQKDPEVPHMDKSGTNVGRPSRTGTIENLPVIYAALKYGQGDYMKTLRTIMYYGRDCESIAAVATGLLAAIHGSSILPRSLMQASVTANQRDFSKIAAEFLQTIKIIHQKDKERLMNREILLNE
ncbi:ADP-ribosylglycohydrolase family protein [Fulvivirga sp. M361]|uniref:ADP-ribosylglycohydrolase family protein n=1 Tax=Fulvivirga sp. M361 TaxID=2594266 RepID=UPI00117A24CA|nr:ADP-ribosylglycohydrolase family protein [Fulvivirga sp. M361]TRX48563.1 ADP-ribosylglycohydrolase family protein [Fulvivirga sp. M361]